MEELKPSAYGKPFQFLRINVLREYLAKEMVACDYSAVGGFNLERVIDDFVFLVCISVAGVWREEAGGGEGRVASWGSEHCWFAAVLLCRQ